MQNKEPSLRGNAVKRIVKEIQSGELAPNVALTEAQICEKFGLSRTPAREALIELVTNGIMIKIPRKGYCVREFTTKDKLDIYAVLAINDAFAAKLAMEHMTEEDYMKMNKLVDLMDISIKYKNYYDYNEQQSDFHQVYTDKCGNQFLIDKLLEIKESVPHYIYYSDSSDKVFDACKEANNEHVQILKFFKAHDLEKLTDLLVNTHWIAKEKYIDMI